MGFERQSVERAIHGSPQGVIDHLVLLNPALAAERFAGDARGKVIAVSGQIHDDDMSFREGLFDEALDIHSNHRHWSLLLSVGRTALPASLLQGRVGRAPHRAAQSAGA
jgi:hypothetical protein